MKKKSLFLLSVLCVCVLFTSCKKDDDTPELNNSIVGTFVFKSAVATEVKTNSVSNDEKVKTYIVNEAEDDCRSAVWIFDAEGNIKLDLGKEDISEGKYTFENGKLSIIWGGDPDYTDDYKANMVNGALEFEMDYTDDVNYYARELLFLINDLGITIRDDIDGFSLDKAIVKITTERR